MSFEPPVVGALIPGNCPDRKPKQRVRLAIASIVRKSAISEVGCSRYHSQASTTERAKLRFGQAKIISNWAFSVAVRGAISSTTDALDRIGLERQAACGKSPAVAERLGIPGREGWVRGNQGRNNVENVFRPVQVERGLARDAVGEHHPAGDDFRLE